MNPFAIIRIYSMFGTMLLLPFLFVYVYDRIKMPVTARLMAMFMFSGSAVTAGWVMIEMRNLPALELCGPILLISLVGLFFWTKSLVKMVPPSNPNP